MNTLVAMFIVTAHLRSFSHGILTDPSIKFIECSQIMCIILLMVCFVLKLKSLLILYDRLND